MDKRLHRIYTSFAMKPRATFLLSLLLWFSASLLTSVNADYDDFVDYSFSCPAKVTCPQVCVSRVQDCPTEMQCRGNQTLCIDGSCVNGECSTFLESPCFTECAPVACARVVREHDACQRFYQELYNAAQECGVSDDDTVIGKSFLRSPLFTFIFSWICGVTLSITLWCAFNERMRPVQRSVKAFKVDCSDCFISNRHKYHQYRSHRVGWQTGYRAHPVGSLLYWTTIATAVGIHCLLGYLTMHYYILQGVFSNFQDSPFHSTEEVLRAFIIIWNIGFVWCFAFKWPESVSTLFLRRCDIRYATHITVIIESKNDSDEINSVFNNTHLYYPRKVLAIVGGYASSIMAVVFSQVDSRSSQGQPKTKFEVCRVQKDRAGGKYITFMYRRYHLHKSAFVPGEIHVGRTIQEISDSATKAYGLTNKQVRRRQNRVGGNEMKMEKPSLTGSLYIEFCKPFYIYQIFMIWSW
jgi:Cation transporter/ATPase, N-terminus